VQKLHKSLDAAARAHKPGCMKKLFPPATAALL
jgi:hypothetical protein